MTSHAAASDNDGGLIWRDMRQPMADAKRWNIDYYKGEGASSSEPLEPHTHIGHRRMRT